MKSEGNGHTVYALAQFYDLPKRHSFTILCREVWEDTRSKCDLFVQVAFRETISAKLELRRVMITEIGVEDTQWVEICDMMTADLVCTDEKLNLTAC